MQKQQVLKTSDVNFHEKYKIRKKMVLSGHFSDQM